MKPVTIPDAWKAAKMRMALQAIADYAKTADPATLTDAKATINLLGLVAREGLDADAALTDMAKVPA